MSGHNGFIAVGNNNQPINPIIANNVGGVQPPANPNPPVGVPGGGVPQPVAPEQVGPGEIARQLDVLLMQAGKMATKGIDADALKVQVRGFGLGKGEVKAARRLPIHRDPPPFTEILPATELLETGIKVVDLLCPYARGG